MPLECALYYSDDIKGANTIASREGSSVVVEFNHQVQQPVDTQKGEVSGARVHHTVEMLTENDRNASGLGQFLSRRATTEWRLGFFEAEKA